MDRLCWERERYGRGFTAEFLARVKPGIGHGGQGLRLILTRS
jgi:hypothetical protein